MRVTRHDYESKNFKGVQPFQGWAWRKFIAWFPMGCIHGPTAADPL